MNAALRAGTAQIHRLRPLRNAIHTDEGDARRLASARLKAGFEMLDERWLNRFGHDVRQQTWEVDVDRAKLTEPRKYIEWTTEG